MLQIPLSLSGPADAFAAAVEAHRLALVEHRAGAPGIPAPLHANPLIDQLMVRQSRPDPLPTEFLVAPYEIVDDSPTLEERKGALLQRLHNAANVARNEIVSPARLELLNLNFGEALSITEESRTPAQVTAIEAYVAVDARRLEIARNVAHAAIEIEDLPSIAATEAWKVPAL